MGYIGNAPYNGIVNEGNIADNAVTQPKVADDAVGLDQLSATGTASSSTYLRGDNSWVAVPAATPGGSTTQVQYNNAGAFGGSANFVWDNSNVRLGVGTASPTDQLQVQTSSSGTTPILLSLVNNTASANATGVKLWMSGRADSSINRGVYLEAVTTNTSNAHDLAFATSASGNAPTERMRITSDGNVGIGTSSVTTIATSVTTLEIKGKATFRSGGLKLSSSDDSIIFRLFGADATVRIGSQTATPFLFYTNDTERMRIDSSGNVGIGTTSPSATYGAKLAVAGGNIIADFDRTIGFQWSGGLNQYFKGMSGVPQLAGGARGLHLFNYDNDASQGIRFWGGTVASKVELGGFENSGTFQFNSGYGSVATAYGCRAWVNFNGTDTVSINSSGNVSSVSDRGTGRYTVNFSTAMPDANYATSVTGQKNSGDDGYIMGGVGSNGQTSSAVEVTMQIGGVGPDDVPKCFVVIHR